jgi:hypothetical protein
MESSQWENWNHIFWRKIWILTASHSQFRGVGQGMKHTYLCLWYPLFQAQWDRCDPRNHQTYNYLVTGHHLYSGTLNYRIVLASFRFSCEALVWSLPHTNKGTIRREEEFVLIMYADCLLKNTSTKENKYVVNQKLEHVDDISFRELFGSIRVVFCFRKYDLSRPSTKY